MNYQLFFDSTMPIFIDIMVWVAFSFLVFELINMFTKDKFYNAVSRSKNTQVLWGVLLGLIPGCGGALLLVPLYNKRKVGLAALTAAFIATFGDAAFVILSNDPIMFLHLTWMSAIAGLITGYIMQFTPIESKVQSWIDTKRPERDNKIAKGYRATRKRIAGPEYKRVISKNSLFLKLDRWVLPTVFIFVTGYILPATIAGFFPEHLITGAGVQYWLMTAEWLSYIATLFLIGYYAITWVIRRYFVYSQHLTGITQHMDWSTGTKVRSGDIIEGDEDTGFVSVAHTVFSQLVHITFWVWVGFFSFEIINFYVSDGLQAFFASGSGWTAILVATAVGMIPGCGPQIALATFYFSVPGGGIIGAAMLANSINQDGDAAFPLMVTERRAAIAMRFLNVVPAILFATIYWGIAQSGIAMPF